MNMTSDEAIITGVAFDHRLGGPIDDIISGRVLCAGEGDPLVWSSGGPLHTYALTTMKVIPTRAPADGAEEIDEIEEFDEFEEDENRVYDFTEYEGCVDYVEMVWRHGPADKATGAATGFIISCRDPMETIQVEEHMAQLGFKEPSIGCDMIEGVVLYIDGIEGDETATGELVARIAQDAIHAMRNVASNNIRTIVLNDRDGESDHEKMFELAAHLEELGARPYGIIFTNGAQENYVPLRDQDDNDEDGNDNPLFTAIELMRIVLRDPDATTEATIDNLIGSDSATPATRRAALSQVMAFIAMEGREGWKDEVDRLREAIDALPHTTTDEFLGENEPDAEAVKARQDHLGRDVGDRAFYRSMLQGRSPRFLDRNPRESVMEMIVTEAMVEGLMLLTSRNETQDAQPNGKSAVMRTLTTIAADSIARHHLGE